MTDIDITTMTVAEANARKLEDVQSVVSNVNAMILRIAASQVLYSPSLPAEYQTMTDVCIAQCRSLCSKNGLPDPWAVAPPPTETTPDQIAAAQAMILDAQQRDADNANTSSGMPPPSPLANSTAS